jgi:hypothetical protein
MSEFQYGRARDRSKLASLRDQAYSGSHYLAAGDLSLVEINSRLAETPCGPMAYQSPRAVVPMLLERTWRFV